MVGAITAAALGILSGVVTGLIPGIHPNTVIFTSLPIYLSTGIQATLYIPYIAGLSVSHTFHDFLPAIFISAPEAESALSVVAAPELVEEGKGLEAFYATVKGGLNSVVAVAIISVPMFFFLDQLYSFLSGIMQYVLIFFLMYIILSSDDVRAALLVAIFSGALGVISFQSSVNQQFVLIPIFSGLFAVPGISSILGQEFEVPEQKAPEESVIGFSSHGFAGTLAGLLAGTIPGIGAAVSTSFVSPLLEDSKKSFLSAMGAVNTSDIFFSLLTLQLIGRARSGVSVALQALNVPSRFGMVFLAALTVLSALVSALVALKVSRVYTEVLEGSAIEKIVYPVLAVILGVTFLLTGLKGFLVLGAASCTGFVAQRTDSRKTCMAVLIVPSIISYSGVAIFM